MADKSPLPEHLLPWNDILPDGWPNSAGPFPTAENIQTATTLGAKPGTKVGLAWAMYCREGGATQTEVRKIANSTQRNKATTAARNGELEFRRLKRPDGESAYFLGPPGSEPGGPDAIPVARSSREKLAVDREDLLEAMRTFDETERDFADWQGWEQRKYHRYAIRHENRNYPVKHVLSNATGTPTSQFSGGEGQANQIVRRAGFEIVALHQGELIDRDALESLKNEFLTVFPDFQKLTFAASSGGYWDTERAYKGVLIERAKKALETVPPLSDEKLGEQLLSTLIEKPSNLLGWRMQSRLSVVRNANPGKVERAASALARSEKAQPEAVADFVAEIWPLFEERNRGNLPYADIRAIPTMLLALAKPDSAIGVRYQLFHRAGMTLLHRPIFSNAPLSDAEYTDVLSMANQVFEVMRDDWEWAPRDLWDVQGFIWTTFYNSANADDDDDDIRDAEDDTKDADDMASNLRPPTNLILYGPPGTGKTYETVAKAVELCDGRLPAGDRIAVMARYHELLARKRIEFVTFHQSYSYEDFVEGLRPETGADDGDNQTNVVGFRLVDRPGIFQAISERAAANRGTTKATTDDFQGRQVFKMSLGRANNDEEAYLFKEAIAGGYVHLGYGGEIDWSGQKYSDYNEIKKRWRAEADSNASGNDPNIQQTDALRNGMKQGDLVVVSDGNKRFRAIGEIVGPYEFVSRDQDSYHHRRSVNWLWNSLDGLPREEIYEKGFSQVSIYRLDPDHIIWPSLTQILSGESNDTNGGGLEPYVLIIDEINRANVSKVFGELITLIEPDKRLGMPSEITLTLPYSGRKFGVPANLHIVGTMNTADRSIALLDTALRRRFQFLELMPQAELLSEDVDGINLRAALQGLNSRIEYLFDRDHQIGHAYFMECTDRRDVESVMRDKIIPLLVEYFYEDWEKVRVVLNETDDNGAFITREKIAMPQFLGEEDAFESDRWRYSVNRSFSEAAFDQLAS